ncbi:hypothetical protein B1A87_007420 [Arthrobacter sp. KBS0703]|uniref:hypothetical protein n=1 Tax=Arthrobacter sp. KBS0703 TaxID=1955698 RepID=UPI00098EE6B5|nr:hypothetical protein [Arthrobacter sp. KBS0703]TSE15751.1 hypothetical protein B1A87_007420 [Arthrobacter sp. KBS0703]
MTPILAALVSCPAAGEGPQSRVEGVVGDEDTDELLHDGFWSSISSESRRCTCPRANSVKFNRIAFVVRDLAGSGLKTCSWKSTTG